MKDKDLGTVTMEQELNAMHEPGLDLGHSVGSMDWMAMLDKCQLHNFCF